MHRFNLLLERIFDFRTVASRREYVCVFFAVFLFWTVIFTPVLAFVYWIGIYAQRFEFVDQLTDLVLTPENLTLGSIWALIALFGGVVMTVALIFTSIRRLNDMGWRRWWAFSLLVPIVNAVFLVLLIFVPAKLESETVVGKVPTMKA